ncbi:MAG: bacillithiol system redox-active protein YtxJ [Acidobacteriota bacterium]
MAQIENLAHGGDLEAAFERSQQTPVWLFKHSLTCPISRRAWRQFEEFVAGRPADDTAFYGVVRIQEARPLSQQIAERTGIRHESPQALLLCHGQVEWHASHGAIRVASLTEAAP